MKKRLCFALLFAGGLGLCFSLEFSTEPGWSLDIGGELNAALRVYPGDFPDPSLGDVFSGKLRFGASGAYADGTLGLKLRPAFGEGERPLDLDEAYLRTYFGPFRLEGGGRKLTWGRAHSFGPLDVLNPLDYSDLSAFAGLEDRRIARPMFRLVWDLSAFTKLEAVFEPSFQGHRFAEKGRWAPLQFSALPEELKAALGAQLAGAVMNGLLTPAEAKEIGEDYKSKYDNLSLGSLLPNTSTLKYAQAGLRFTAALGPADLGLQYFYGNLFRPALSVEGFENVIQNPSGLELRADYNRYHQIGLDYAQVLGGFNLRAEAAIHLTEDLAGDDGAVYNPFAGWSLGFDRDLFWDVYLNLQGAGTVRLFQDKLGDNPLTDVEAGKDLSSTRIILLLSRKFFNNAVELSATGIWGIEDRDCYIVPSLAWLRDDMSLTLSAGIFAGDEAGELGQYHKNNYVKFVAAYTF